MRGLGRRLARGLGANVLPLGLASFCTDFAAEMVFPLFPVFLAGSLGAGVVWLGVIEGAADSLASFLRIFTGRWSDRLRRRRLFLFAGYGITSLARPMFAVASSVGHVLAIRLADRFGKGIRLSARDALLADSCAPEARGKAFGLQRTLDHLGAALGPLAAWWLVDRGWAVRDIFLVTAIPSALVLLVLLPVKDVSSEPAPPGRAGSLRAFDANYGRFLLAIALFTLANTSDLFLLLRLTEAGFPSGGILLLWSGVSGVRMLGSLPAGILADRWGRKRMVLAGWIVFVFVYAGMAFARTQGLIVALLLVYGLYHAMAESVVRAMVADLVPAWNRGTAYGLYHFFVGLAALPGGIAFGLVWKGFGAPAAFLASATVASIAWLLLLRVQPVLRPAPA